MYDTLCTVVSDTNNGDIDQEREVPSSSTFHSRRYLRRHAFASPHKETSDTLLNLSNDQDLWFDQLLDHSLPSDNRTWKQRYFVSNKFYKPGGPAFLMIGGEGRANPVWMAQGAWTDYAKEFGAKLFMLEHRYNKTGVINYPLGQSTIPTGSDLRLILKFWDGRTNNICEYSVNYRPGLWTALGINLPKKPTRVL